MLINAKATNLEEISELSQGQYTDDDYLRNIKKLDTSLADYYSEKFLVDNSLTRKVVSFQANKERAYYRWYKYKEAFSANLVEYLFEEYHVDQCKILDPFAGSGTALFACSDLGYDTEGIELLPVGHKIIEANKIARSCHKKILIDKLNAWIVNSKWNQEGEIKDFEVLRITDGAYPQETSYKIQRYLYELEKEKPEIKEILIFALLCILESISYTRKDGQYLRWDYRSGRRNGKNTFNKGKIIPFKQAISNKLKEIVNDLEFSDSNLDLFSLLNKSVKPGSINLLKGSCLDNLPKLEAERYSGIITSPPYCNRYDYTRTYALEHAILGVQEDDLVSLRQAMLSCTVENKKKDLLSINEEWIKAIKICENQTLLQEILNYLDYKNQKKELNNKGIARMVRGYFYEMACVLQECYRVLEQDGVMFVVNDNVRYAGASISVDMILSKIAEKIGFVVEKILVVPQTKGNSSQQMGRHGREVLRKCVYVWRKES